MSVDVDLFTRRRQAEGETRFSSIAKTIYFFPYCKLNVIPLSSIFLSYLCCSPSSPAMNKHDCEILCTFSKCPPYCHLPPVFSPPSPRPPQQSYRATLILSFLACVVLLAILFSIIAKYFCNRNTSRRSPAPTISSTHQDQTRRDDRSVGLEESVINSITVCKYKRGGGLFEGVVCSICLNEFHEDENLRLLPNCVHGFHLPCIDKWLKSNVNCPLCRTNVMSNPLSSVWRNSSSSSSSSGSGEEPQNHIGLEINGRDGVGGNRSVLGADEMANDHDEIQLVRVSVTVDSTAASMITKEVASN